MGVVFHAAVFLLSKHLFIHTVYERVRERERERERIERERERERESRSKPRLKSREDTCTYHGLRLELVEVGGDKLSHTL